MTQLQKYQYATWILAIVAIILAIMLISSNKKEAVSGVEEATMAIEKCNQDLAAWRLESPTPNNATPAQQEELLRILKSCSGDVGETDTTPEAIPAQ